MTCKFDQVTDYYAKVDLTVNIDINKFIDSSPDCQSYLKIETIEPVVKSVFIGQEAQEFDLPVFLADTSQTINSECGNL